LSDFTYYLGRDRKFLDDLYSYLSRLQGGYASQSTRARHLRRYKRAHYWEVLSEIVGSEKDGIIKTFMGEIGGITTTQNLLNLTNREITEVTRIRNFIVNEYPELERKRFIEELNWYLSRYVFKREKLIPPKTYTLTVKKAGTGSGTVTSSPPGINCGPTCSATYSPGTSVTLTATPDDDSTFTGWSGGDTGTLTVIMNSDVTVTATFTSEEKEEVELIGRNTDTSKNIYYNKEREKYFELDEDEEGKWISTEEGKTYLDITEETEGLRYEDWLEVRETVSVDTSPEHGHEPFAAEITSRTRLTKTDKKGIDKIEGDIQTGLNKFFHEKPGFNQIKSEALKIGVEFVLPSELNINYPMAKVLIEKTNPIRRRRKYPEEEVMI
jgi:hypothetical protein